MGANLGLWIPSFVLGHVLGLIFLLYALEKINGSLSRLGKQISLLAARGRTKDAPSPASTTTGDGNSAAAAAGKGAALAKERAAALKQTSLYADDGDNASANAGADGGFDGGADGAPPPSTPRRALLPRWNRACKCEVSREKKKKNRCDEKKKKREKKKKTQNKRKTLAISINRRLGLIRDIVISSYECRERQKKTDLKPRARLAFGVDDKERRKKKLDDEISLFCVSTARLLPPLGNASIRRPSSAPPMPLGAPIGRA